MADIKGGFEISRLRFLNETMKCLPSFFLLYCGNIACPCHRNKNIEQLIKRQKGMIHENFDSGRCGLARLLLTETILVSIKLAHAHFRDTDSSSGFSLTGKQLRVVLNDVNQF